MGKDFAARHAVYVGAAVALKLICGADDCVWLSPFLAKARGATAKAKVGCKYVCTVVLITCMAVGLALGIRRIAAPAERRADAAYGVVYIAPPVVAMVWLRSLPDGLWWTLLLFVVTWFADIFAYVAGSLFKGPKLWPRISPNKTWSGFIGGLVAATVGAVVVSELANLRLIWPAAALVGFLGGLATMAGDLWESTLKRRFGVKDSGDLIPGHGGLLDRVDGLMFAAIVVALIRLIDHWGWAH